MPDHGKKTIDEVLAAPRVIRKLAKWLVQKGYDPDADYAVG